MQTFELFSIYDMKAKAYGNPFCAINSDIAKRLSVHLFADKRTTQGAYPSDFALYRIGNFSDDTALVTDHCNMLIATGDQILREYTRSFIGDTSAAPSEVTASAEGAPVEG